MNQNTSGMYSVLLFKIEKMKSILILLLTFASLQSLAQSLRGKVCDKESASALSYGNVDIYQEDVLVASVLTDALGNFNVALDTGIYRCVINYAGHISEEKQIHVVNDEKADFTMADDPSKPKPAVRAYESEAGYYAKIEAKDVARMPEVGSSERIIVKGERSSGRAKVKSSVSGWDYAESDAPISDYESMDYSIAGDVPGGMGGARSGTLTAGEVNDFSKWDMWQDLSKEELGAFATAWGIAPFGRYTLQLTNLSGLPIVDARVSLVSKGSTTAIFTARTDNTGKAELWLSTSNGEQARANLSMEIEYMGTKETVKNVKPFAEAINHHMMDVACWEINNVDIAFVVDATGSMGDELAYLQAEMNDIVFKTKQISSKLDFHFANVFYRDQGDEYTTRSMDFSRVLSESVEFVNAQHANGGGDYEEAVEFALDSAINNLSWSEDARSRIVFMILDAPPHNTPEVRAKMDKLMRTAAEKGIRIVPVGASGINKATEYLLRTLAIGTNGTYTFLTDHSGIGNGHIAPSTDEYKVETFNDLMVRILKSYTYMPDCQQNIPDLQLDYPDSVVSLIQQSDSILSVDSLLLAQDSLNVRDTLNGNQNQQIPQIKWSYYPNPTNGIINIKADVDINELFITDLSGKLLQSVKNISKDRVEQIDLSQYTTGIYLIRYLYEDRWISGKVVLQHG